MRYPAGMHKSPRVQWGFLLLGLASTYFLLTYVLPAVSSSSQGVPASGTCIHRQHHLIAKGRSPGDRRWTVTGTIRNSGSCGYWLFGMNFVFSGPNAGAWRGAWGILAGGHLSNSFTIGAQDETESSEQVFSGVVGSRVKTILLTISNGDRLVIHPKLPRQRLRKRFVWLRSMRYFVHYYNTGQHVKVARLLNSQGEIIFTARGEEGVFEGLN